MKRCLLFFAICFTSLFANTEQFEQDPAYKILHATLQFPYDIAPLYNPWTSDPDFLEVRKVWSKVCKIDSSRHDTDEPARYLQYILSRNALAVQGGDFIECGVQNGLGFFIFAAVLDLWDTQNRSIYGFDSFVGLASPTLEDLHATTGTQFFSAGALAGSTREQIEAIALECHCHSEVVQGWIPHCFQGYEDKRFCFAHIDVDLYQSTIDSLTFVYPRMLKGGIILFDDYGFPMCKGARKAIDEYLSDKPEVLIKEPIGRAYIRVCR